MVFRRLEDKDYSWEDCGRGEFNCSLSYSNVIVTRRTVSTSQSGQYEFYCGDDTNHPVVFCVEVSGDHCPPPATLM